MSIYDAFFKMMDRWEVDPSKWVKEFEICMNEYDIPESEKDLRRMLFQEELQVRRPNEYIKIFGEENNCG